MYYIRLINSIPVIYYNGQGFVCLLEEADVHKQCIATLRKSNPRPTCTYVYRKDPVPGVHKKTRWYQVYRDVQYRQIQQERKNPETKRMVRRTSRRNIDPWDQEPVRSRWRSKNWKDCSKRKKQWKPKPWRSE